MFRQDERGFTLLEMLVVVFIIGVIIAIVIPNLSKTGNVANDKAQEANIRMLQAQAENFRLAEGRYPQSADELKAQKFIKEVPVCANSAEFVFTVNTDNELEISCPK